MADAPTATTPPLTGSLPASQSCVLDSSGSPIAILGVPFDHLTMYQALDRIEEMIRSGQSHYLVTANVDFLVQAREDVELRRILCEADLVLCDGTPLLWSARVLGKPLPERVAGSDMVPLLLRRAEATGWRVFFLGASPEAGKAAEQRLARDYPHLQLAGVHSPPYRDLLQMDHEEIARCIKQAAPDILLVCFGCPKQEKWIAMHYEQLGVPVSIGVGGTLDFLAGRLRRAPLWMRRTGLEWLFRLAQEPRRLLRRYVKDFSVFGVRISEQWLRLRARDAQPGGPDASVKRQRPDCIQAPAVLNYQTADALYREALSHSSGFGSLLLDLGQTRSIDSTGVGCLLRIRSKFRRMGEQFICFGLTPSVHTALDLLRVKELLTVCDDLGKAEALLRNSQISQPVRVRLEAEECRLQWHGEVTAANAKSLWELSWPHVMRNAECRWVVDLERVPFIDSSGLSVMIRLRNAARQAKIPIRFTGAKGSVLNAVRISKMTALLEQPPEIPPGSPPQEATAHA